MGITLVFDLYGVLISRRIMGEEYRLKVPPLLAARFGGAPEAWTAAYDLHHRWWRQQFKNSAWGWDSDFGRAQGLAECAFYQRLAESQGHQLVEQGARELMVQTDQVIGLSTKAFFEDAQLAMREARAHSDWRLVVASSAPLASVEAILAGGGVRNLVDRVFASGQVGHRKQTADFWIATFDQLGAVPQETIIIDNSLGKLRPAHQLGARTIFVQRETKDLPTEADFPLDDIRPDLWQLQRTLWAMT